MGEKPVGKANKRNGCKNFGGRKPLKPFPRNLRNTTGEIGLQGGGAEKKVAEFTGLLGEKFR